MREMEYNGGRFGCFTASDVTCKRSIFSLTIVITSRAVSGNKLVSVLFVDLSESDHFHLMSFHVYSVKFVHFP